MARVAVRRIILLAVLVLVIAIQFYPTGLDRSAPDPSQAIESVLQPGPEVARILARSCDDCHGTARVWPWYASVAPASWLVAGDVKDAKGKIDFAHWAQYPPRRQARFLEAMNDEVRQGGMPLPKYLWMHRNARLSAAEKQLFGAWTERERAKLGAPAEPDQAGEPGKRGTEQRR